MIILPGPTCLEKAWKCPLAAIQKQTDDSEPSNSKLPLSAVSLSDEKPKRASPFAQESVGDHPQTATMAKLAEKIKDMKSAMQKLGVIMEEVNCLASSVGLTGGINFL